MTETKIVELVISDDNQELAIDAISLVTSPAIESEFIFFGKEKNNLTFAKVDEEKRMLISPALIPNKNIFRHDPNTDSDYYVYFSKDTVRKASELYLKHNNHHKATYQHQDRVSGILTVESWIIEDTKLDKSTLYGYSLPVGTWMVKLSISNDEIWSKIKSGELKGLSIEGYFTNKFEQMQKTKPTTKEILSAFNELVREGKVQNMSLSKKLELAKKFEFKNIKTLDKLAADADLLTDDYYILEDDVQGDVNAQELRVEEVEKYTKQIKEAEDDFKSTENDITSVKQDLDKLQDELKFSKSYMKDVNVDLKTSTKELKEWSKKVDTGKKKLNDLVKKASKTASELKSGIASFEKSAKELGLDVPQLKEYKDAYSDALYISKLKPKF